MSIHNSSHYQYKLVIAFYAIPFTYFTGLIIKKFGYVLDNKNPLWLIILIFWAVIFNLIYFKLMKKN